MTQEWQTSVLFRGKQCYYHQCPDQRQNKELIATNMNSIKSEYVEEDDTKEDLPKEDSNNVNDTEDELEYTHLCDICNKRFSSKNTRSKHVNCVHKEKRYPCRQC